MLIMSGSFAALFICWYAIGFFSFTHVSDLGVSNAYGLYAFNLNSLYNPSGWSALLPAFPLVSWHQYESFMYLGAGMIGLILIVLLFSGVKLAMSGVRPGMEIEKARVSLVPVAAVCNGR